MTDKGFGLFWVGYLASAGLWILVAHLIFAGHNQGDFVEWPDGRVTVVWCGEDQTVHCNKDTNTFVVDTESGPVTWGVVEP